MSFVDTLFGVTPELLSHRAKRLEMISSNLANADTPGYKAADLDFESIYAQQSKGLTLKTTDTDHLNLSGSSVKNTDELQTLYRTPHQYRLDGNTVETDVERMEFMDNAIRYQAGVTFLGNKASSIISTLRGE